MKPERVEELLMMIDDCEQRDSQLSDWEIKFIDSISVRLLNGPPTERQIEKLEEIWERVT